MKVIILAMLAGTAFAAPTAAYPADPAAAIAFQACEQYSYAHGWGWSDNCMPAPYNGHLQNGFPWNGDANGNNLTRSNGQ